MQFPYVLSPAGADEYWQPDLPVTIYAGKGRQRTLSALVDSGSDTNLFGLDVANALGISLEREIPVQISGVGREVSDGRLTVVELGVGEYRWAAPVIFSEAANGEPILGQDGFFAFFDVTFRFQKLEFEIHWVESERSPTRLRG